MLLGDSENKKERFQKLSLMNYKKLQMTNFKRLEIVLSLMVRNLVAVIGGSGVHDSPAFKDAEWKSIYTGYIEPRCDADTSQLPSEFQRGTVEYQEGDGVFFIPRHGRSETVRYGPSATQYGANILAAKMLGANIIIATSAVGSLKPETIHVQDIVIPHDYSDESGRSANFWGLGIVMHRNPRPAFSPQLRELLLDEARQGGYFQAVCDRANYVTIPGDDFGTAVDGRRRAVFADIVGMTVCPEAALAMQLDMHYACAAFPVDIDSDASHEGQTVAIMKLLSVPEKVPAYITCVVERAKTLELPDIFPQIKGGIIPGNLNYIANQHLRKIAGELVAKYCG